MKSARVQPFAVYATIVFAAFLLGFVPMWLAARTRANERNAAQQALRLAQIENTLAVATIQARRLRARARSGKYVLRICGRNSIVPILASPYPRAMRCRHSSPSAIR